MGNVHEVRRLRDDARFALKIMHPGLLDDPKALRRFEREVQAGSRIASDHVVRVVESGFDDTSGVPWLVMEYAEGTTLQAYVEEHDPVPRDHVEAITSQLFEAVAAGHAIGIVHRDLKPDNILVQERDGAPFIKVLDFGIAKDLKALTGLHTAEGLGTPIWTAPDQSKPGYVARPRDDVWPLGLITFFLLTGKLYWRYANEGRSMVELSMELLRGEIEPASLRAAALDRAGRIPAGFDGWFARSVSRDASVRFGDASEAGLALRGVWSGRTVPGDSVRRLRWMIVVGFVLVLAAGVLVVMGWGRF